MKVNLEDVVDNRISLLDVKITELESNVSTILDTKIGEFDVKIDTLETNISTLIDTKLVELEDDIVSSSVFSARLNLTLGNHFSFPGIHPITLFMQNPILWGNL